MKTLGLIGGMSWESTALYYSGLNRGIASELGQLHSAKMMIGNVDFEEIVQLQRSDRWSEAGSLLSGVATRLVAAGADAIALAVNTMHKVAPQVSTAVGVPFLDIRDAVAKKLQSRNVKICGLLGTSYVMKEEFYRRHITEAGGIEVVTPDDDGAIELNEIIYGELSKGVISDRSRERVLEMIKTLQKGGATGVVLGCTELPMLALDSQSPIALFDSTALHIDMCLEFMLGRELG